MKRIIYAIMSLMVTFNVSAVRFPNVSPHDMEAEELLARLPNVPPRDIEAEELWVRLPNVPPRDIEAEELWARLPNVPPRDIAVEKPRGANRIAASRGGKRPIVSPYCRAVAARQRKTQVLREKTTLQKKRALAAAKMGAVYRVMEHGNECKRIAQRVNSVAARDLKSYDEKLKVVVEFMRVGRKTTSPQILDRYVKGLDTCMEVAQDYANDSRRICEEVVIQQKQAQSQKPQRWGGMLNPLNWVGL